MEPYLEERNQAYASPLEITRNTYLVLITAMTTYRANLVSGIQIT